ncbi:MAG: TonB-dependent receptor [Pseudomonadota bacterium]
MNPHMKRIGCSRTPMAMAVATALFGMAALAQAQEATANGQLETVMVTANKRLEKLESVPMAISVLTEAEIQRTNLREMEDLVNLSPSLQLVSGTTAANNAIFMRGIGTVSVGIGVESDVAVIVDDIPIATQFQAFRDLADVSRIEVLKGPQSTLFGKSAVAGAINIVTKPISGPVTYRASGYYTNDKETRYSVSAGGSTSDRFGFRVAVSKSEQPGTFHNLTTGQDVNGSSGLTMVGKFSWHPASNFDVDFMPSYTDQQNTRGVTAVNGFFLNGQPIGTGSAYLNGNASLPASVNLAGIDVNDPNNRNVRRDSPTGLNSINRIAGLKLTYTLPNEAQLMLISSLTRYDARDWRDQDFVDVPTLARPGTPGLTVGNNQFGFYQIRSKTEELRLVSPDHAALRYVAGLWWARNEIDRHFIRGFCVAPANCSGTSPSSPTNYFTDIYNANKSVFGQLTWDVLPATTLVAGARYNQEESGYNYQRSFYTDQIERASFTPGPVGVDQFSSSGNKDTATTGKLSLQHQLNKDWMAYVMAATGYKGKAYDVTSGLKAASSFPIAPERSQTLEIGAKANLLDNRMTVAAVAYNSEFFGYQQNVSFVLPNDPTIYTQLNSIPRIRTHGFELDSHLLVTRSFSMSGSLALTIPTIEQWKNGPCYSDASNLAVGTTKLAANGSIAGQNAACFPIVAGSTTGVQDLTGKVFSGTPKWKANIGGNYDFGLSEGLAGFVNGVVRYQNDYLTNINNDPRQVNKAYKLVDIGFGVRAANDRWRLSFRVNNLFNTFYINNANASGPAYRNGPTASSPAITVNSWVPPRDVFRYFSVKLDFKY